MSWSESYTLHNPDLMTSGDSSSVEFLMVQSGEKQYMSKDTN